jgi:hypothetical protein
VAAAGPARGLLARYRRGPHAAKCNGRGETSRRPGFGGNPSRDGRDGRRRGSENSSGRCIAPRAAGATGLRCRGPEGGLLHRRRFFGGRFRRRCRSSDCRSPAKINYGGHIIRRDRGHVATGPIDPWTGSVRRIFGKGRTARAGATTAVGCSLTRSGQPHYQRTDTWAEARHNGFETAYPDDPTAPLVVHNYVRINVRSAEFRDQIQSLTN